MNLKCWRATVLVVLLGFVALGPSRAQDAKPTDEGKAEEFKGKTFDLKEKGEAAITLNFPAEKKATITVRGGKTTVHLFIHDAAKKLIDKDDSEGPDCNLTLTPKESGKYTLLLRNKGPGETKTTLKVEVAK